MIKVKEFLGLAWVKILEFLKRFGLGVWKAAKCLPYAGYTMLHPLDGFYRIKNEKKGSVASGCLIFVILIISHILRRQLTGYMYADETAQLNLDLFYEIAVCILPFILWAISNWCFSSLMDGDGKLSDVFVATAVATIPMIIVNILIIPLTQWEALDESTLIEFLTAAGPVITIIYLILSMMVVHQYTVGKTIATTILTGVGMLIIAFVVILIFYLVQQMYGFVTSLFTEIDYRINE